MFSTEFSTGTRWPVICPNCGDSHYESNRFDETLFDEVAREISLMLFEGKRAEAKAELIALHAVRIENSIRPEFLCLGCGVQFDG